MPDTTAGSGTTTTAGSRTTTTAGSGTTTTAGSGTTTTAGPGTTTTAASGTTTTAGPGTTTTAGPGTTKTAASGTTTTAGSGTTTTSTPGPLVGLAQIINNLNQQAGSSAIDTTGLLSSLTALQGNSLPGGTIQEEADYLRGRIQNMDGSVGMAKRNLLLNESDRLRSQDYNYILYLFIGMLIIIIILTILNRWFPGLPYGVLEYTIVIVVLIFFILMYNKYVAISNRDTINYNEVALPPPNNVNLSQQQINEQNARSSKTMAGGGYLLNFSSNNQNCPAQVTTPSTSNGFTLLKDAQPNSFYEYNSYSPV
jgi:hypothetical protein